MKPVKAMSLGELGAYVCTLLKQNGVKCVLSGGACVSIYTNNRYQSFDLDFVENISSSRSRIRDILASIGFHEENRYFKHDDTEFFVEFPSGPLAVGSEPVKNVVTKSFSTGTLSLLSPTDCIKDRLAAYYHWNDRQSLEQAIRVAESNEIDLAEVQRWSFHEKKKQEFLSIKAQFEQAQQKQVD